MVPDSMYDTIADRCDSGKSLSISEAVRYYINLGLEYDDMEEV